MTSPQKPVVSNTLDPPPASGNLQASPAGACLHDKLQSCGGSTMNACVQCMNFINNIVHRILPHYQLMASCQLVFSVVHWLQDISVKWTRRLISGS